MHEAEQITLGRKIINNPTRVCEACVQGEGPDGLTTTLASRMKGKLQLSDGIQCQTNVIL